MRSSKNACVILYVKKFALMIMCLLLIFSVCPVSANADDSAAIKTVRVGRHEPPYFITDESGRYSGYTYDYQQKIAAYTGWSYEYVDGGWSELLGKLKDGEIDMLGNVSLSEERAKDMLFSSLPMGTETYYLFVSPRANDIRYDDCSSMNGKKIGVAKDSYQSKLLADWLQTNSVSAEIVEMTSQEEEALGLLDNGIDAYVTMDFHADPQESIPLWKIGSSDFFFAVSKSRPDLLNSLNFAMSRIKDESTFFSMQLNEKYLRNTEAELYISDQEKDWLNNHGTIRVGYQDNYLAFCSADTKTGELTGALKDYLDYASTALKNASLSFETVSYPNVSEAIEDLKAGKLDCVFPANLAYFDSETHGLAMTPSIMTTEIDAVVRSSDRKDFLQKEQLTAAVNEGNINYELFLKEHFPHWEIKHFKDTAACLDAVAKGDADCVIISNYRLNNISKQCEQLHLSTVYTGLNTDYYFALRKGDANLYSILSRITSAVPEATIHTALTYYSTEDMKTDFSDYIKENWGIAMSIVAVIFLIITLLLLRIIHVEKKALKEANKVNALNKKVYVDTLTRLRNKAGYTDYVNLLSERVKSGEVKDFCVCVFDCDDLKYINDRYGHQMGDEYLKNASRLICRIFEHSPVFRVGGDEFIAFLLNRDYENRDELLVRFEQESTAINESAVNEWEHVNVSLGIARYDADTDKSIEDTEARADEKMYENKRRRKEARMNK